MDHISVSVNDQPRCVLELCKTLK